MKKLAFAVPVIARADSNADAIANFFILKPSEVKTVFNC